MTDGKMRFQLAVWAVSLFLPSLLTVPLGQCSHCRVSLCTRVLYSPPSLISAAPLKNNNNQTNKKTMAYFKLCKAEHGTICLGHKTTPNPINPIPPEKTFIPRKPQGSQHLIQNISETQGLWYPADHSYSETQNQEEKHNPYMVLAPILQ